MSKKPDSWSKSYCSTLIAILLTALLTSACETLPSFDRGPEQPPGVKTAIKLAEQGDHNAASQQYVQLAISSSGDQKQRYYLFAARELYLGNELNAAEQTVESAGALIAGSNLSLWAEVVASIRMAQDQPEAALTALNKVTEATDRETATRILKLRAEALFELGRLQAAVATLVRREDLLQKRADIYANHQLIWNNLERSTTPISTRSIETATDPLVAGWLELGQISEQRRGSLDQLRTQILQWQQAHPSHPANSDLLPNLLEQLAALSNYPANVAVLLPLSGKQKILGEVIRDGYLTALYSLSESAARPTIRFYDTARGPASAAYDLAINNGAEFVVGPLLKENVNDIVDRVDKVTTLTLNFANEAFEPPDNLYQFALAPEDEARSIARRAAAEGWLNAVVLVPENTWGTRVYEAFGAELNAHGGQILAVRAFPNDTPDYSNIIRNILLIDESNARHDRLAANLGKQLEYEPRRREDLDFIFVAATAPTAKLLRPQLRFHYAGNVPTFATSAVYIPGSDNNSELDGMIFTDVPWLINPTVAVAEQQQALREIWGANADLRARFFALGYDAYQLTALLNGRSGRFQLSLEGTTGKIMMDPRGLLHRDLEFARIKDGKPQLMAEPARAPSPVTVISPQSAPN